MRGDSSKIVIIVTILALVLPQISSSFAVPINWDGGGDGSDWFDPNNWDLDVLPSGSDDITVDGNANVDLSNQFLITSGSLTIKAGSSLFMTEDSPTTLLGVGGLLTNNGTITVSNEVEVTGTLINNGDITIQSDFEDVNSQIFIVEEQGILLNNGNILVTANAGIDGFNFLNNLGNITIAANGRYQNGYNTTNKAIFNVRDGGSVNNALNFTNDGTIIIEGEFTGDGSQDVLTNNGNIEIKPSGFFGMNSDSLLENKENFTNSGSAFLARVTNTGTIFNVETLEITNLVSNDNNFTNNGDVELSSEISIGGTGFFRNNGQITMGKDFGGEGTVEGIITNNSVFENNDLITIAIGRITNNDKLINDGVITNQDQINNNGNGKITNAGTINNNGVIDNQNIINNCGTLNGNAPLGGTLNGFCPATIIVVKDTVPNDSSDFGFSSTTLTPATFSLDDDSQGPLENKRRFEDLAPGLYNVSETFSSSYITIPNCDDGSSIKSINAQSDETITCIFTNLLDSDLDGLATQIDTNSLSFTNDFDDMPLGNNGKTNGTITDRKSLTVWVTEEPNPGGVRIRALNGPSQNATVSVCNGASTISLNDGDEVIVTCGSVDLTTVSGSPLILFNSQGVRSSTILPQGNGIFFEPSTFRFSVPAGNSDPLPLEIEAAAKIIVEFPQNEQNSFVFEPETVTFTSDASNEGDLAIIIGDKEGTIPPNSSISPLVAIDQSITINKDQQVEIILSSLGGTDITEAVFEIVTPPLGQLIQDGQNSAIISYTPNTNFVGTDRFEFKAVKGAEESNTGIITIKVEESLVKRKINGKYIGKFDEPTFTSSGNFKIGRELFKKVNVSGTFDLIENNAKCSSVLGSGIMDFKNGNTVNIEFSAETCKAKKFFSRLDGTINFVGGTGIFDGSKGTAKFSQINLQGRLVGNLNGEIFVKP